jgi:hypothetical protein
MNKLLLILFTFSFPFFLFSQGSYTQTSTGDFYNNVNFNISTLNDELKLICDKGTGAQGDLNVLVENSIVIDSPRTYVTGDNYAGQYFINVASSVGFNINDEVLIITSMHGSVDRAGQYEFRRIQNKTSTILYFTDPLRNTYDAGNTHQVVRVPNYNNVTIAGTLTCSPWNGQTGGILVFRATGLVKVTNTGTITVDTMGYRYGPRDLYNPSNGEGILGNGGGAGCYPMRRCPFPRHGGSGNGGGYGTIGHEGVDFGCCLSHNSPGQVIGDSILSKIYFGGAGGQGGCGSADIDGCTDIGGRGGRGAGIIYFACDSLSIVNYITSNGQEYGSPSGQYGGIGGNGAGGTIFITSQKNINIGDSLVTAYSDWLWQGMGRIRIDAPNVSGYSNPGYKYSVVSYSYIGYSISPPVTKPSNNGWLTLTFNADTSLTGTSVRFDVLNMDDSVLLSNLQSGSNLNNLGLSQSINNIKLKARLTNTNGDKTPKLYDWTINWDASVPSQPVLISPTNSSIDISLTPLLDWGDVATATNYRLQVSNNSGFTSFTINDSSLTSSQYTISSGLLSYGTTYYWRVSAKNSLGWSVYSAVYNFTTLLHVPGAPILILPANGATGQPTTVTFKWYKAVETLLKSIIQGDNEHSLKNEMNGPLTIGNYWFEYGTDSTFATVIERDSSLTDTTKTVSGLSNITRYFWRVKAKNQAGWSNFSTAWNFTTVVPIPAVPALLTPANNTVDIAVTPTLDWNDVTYAASYRVQISTDSSFTTTVYDTAGLTVSQIIVPSGKLTTKTQYYWRVNATNISGTSAYSTIWSFTTAPNAPNVPILSLPSNGATNQPTTVTFKWYKAVETFLGLFIKKEKKIQFKNESDEPLNISKYWFEYGTDSTLSTVIARDSSLSDTTKTISGLSNITKYYWRVKAKNQSGWGNFSSIWNFTTIVPVPAAPILISPVTGSIDISLTPALDWGDVLYASSYRLQISLDSLFGTTAFDSSGITVSNLTVPSGKLTTLKKYYWRANATNIAGTGVWSSVWNFTTIPNLPNAPILVSPPNGSTGQPINLTFVWRNAIETLLTKSQVPENRNKQIPFNDDVLTLSKYWLEYTSTDSTFVTGVVRDSSATDTTKSVILAYNTKYWWRVKSKNQTGWGSFSAVWSFTTILPVPIAPALLLPANNATGVSLTPLLDWSDVASAASYRIQVSSDSIFAVTVFDTTGVTVSKLTVPSVKLTGLTKYYWRVNATNAVGTGPWSTIWNFRTLQNLTLNLKVYLEGFWTGTIQKQDTVMVYLAGALTPHTFSDSAKVFLSPTGTALITFTKTPNASYYLVVQHRNHLQTWSAFAQVFITNIMVNYDFTTADSQAYGSNMKQVESVWVLIVGDENQDGSIDAVDVSDLIIQYGNIGYLSCDFNCDGSVDAADVPYMIANYGLTKVVPTLLLEPNGTRKQKQMMLQEKPNNFLKENKIDKINSN